MKNKHNWGTKAKFFRPYQTYHTFSVAAKRLSQPSLLAHLAKGNVSFFHHLFLYTHNFLAELL
jgi:hypothetical protein